MSQRVRNLCFTVNETEGSPLLQLDPTLWASVKYCVWQLEAGTNTHFQGYMELDSKVAYSTLHDYEGLETAHFEARRGSAKQAAHYCMKPVDGCACRVCAEERESPTKLEGPWTYGEPSHQGQRTELLEIQSEIKAGAPIKRIMDDHFAEFVRYRSGLIDAKRRYGERRTRKTMTFLFIGPAGHGKTTMMEKILPKALGLSVYKVPAKKGSGLYFDDYDGEDILVVDEMNGNVMTPEFFNGLADEHEFILPVHGSAGHQMRSQYLFVGTNYLPREWWKKRSPAQVRQTTRRIDVVFKMGFKYAEREQHAEHVENYGHCLQCDQAFGFQGKPCAIHHL